MNYTEIEEVDNEIYELLCREDNKVDNTLNFTYTTNIPSKAVRAALTNISTFTKNEECRIKELAENRAKFLFGMPYANVQYQSIEQANETVYSAFLRPGDSVLTTDFNSLNNFNRFIKIIHCPRDVDMIMEMIYTHRPRLFITGTSPYPRVIDFKILGERIREYNRSVPEAYQCYFMYDMSDTAGFAATTQYKDQFNPAGYADIITFATERTLCGPRGGIILMRTEDIFNKISKVTIYEDFQINSIAAKAICFKEAMQSKFERYIRNIHYCSNSLVEYLSSDFYIFDKGTDNHLIIFFKDDNKHAKDLLAKVGMFVNTFGQNDRILLSTAALCRRYHVIPADMLVISESFNEVLNNGNLQMIREDLEEFYEDHPLIF